VLVVKKNNAHDDVERHFSTVEPCLRGKINKLVDRCGRSKQLSNHARWQSVLNP